MRLYVAIIILGLAMIATAVGLMAKPLETPTLIDAQSPGVWPTYAAAGHDSDLMCIHVPTPRAMRRYQKEIRA